MLKTKCKGCDNNIRVYDRFVINDKTVCPKCKVIITSNGEVIEADEFIDLPLEERVGLKEVLQFRKTISSKLPSAEEFRTKTQRYIDVLFGDFESIDFKLVKESVIEYLVENGDEMEKPNIKLFIQILAITNAADIIQTGIETLTDEDKKKFREIINQIHQKVGYIE
jgi:hypothetical protein